MMKYFLWIFLLSIANTVLIAQDWMGKDLAIDNSFFAEEVIAAKQVKSIKVVCSRPEIDEEGRILEKVFTDTVYIAQFNEKGEVGYEIVHPLFKEKCAFTYWFNDKGQLINSERVVLLKRQNSFSKKGKTKFFFNELQQLIIEEYYSQDEDKPITTKYDYNKKGLKVKSSLSEKQFIKYYYDKADSLIKQKYIFDSPNNADSVTINYIRDKKKYVVEEVKKSSPFHIKKCHSECAVGEAWHYFYKRDEKGRVLKSNNKKFRGNTYEYIDFKDGYLRKTFNSDGELQSTLFHHTVETESQTIVNHGNKTLIKMYRSPKKQLLQQVQLVDKSCVSEPHIYTFDFYYN